MKKNPLVSIIILNHNGEHFLNNFLSSVFQTQYSNFEVILVDNASTDKSLSLVNKISANRTNLKVIRNGKNSGFGPANNFGFKHTNGSYIVFLNNDTIVEPEWLSTLVDAIENDQTIGLAQSLILECDDQKVQTVGIIKCDYWVKEYSIGSNRNAIKFMFPVVFSRYQSQMERQ